MGNTFGKAMMGFSDRSGAALEGFSEVGMMVASSSL
jgi:hypothetical protein